MTDEEHKSGWLLKEGSVWNSRSWKKCWFSLRGPKLNFYKSNKEGEKAVGSIVLEPSTSVEKVAIADGAKLSKTDKEYQFMFQVVASSRTHSFLSDSEQNRDSWVTEIQEAITARQLALKPAKKKISKDDFENVKFIGRGSFGKVYLVRYRPTGEAFAMKQMLKSDIVASNEIEHTMNEVSILQRLRHPFLVRLHYSFQTADKLFLILDFINGGEIYFHLQREKRFPEQRVRFYASEILLGLEYLHKNGVLYRDLKLENLLLSRDGHVVMTDFGLSKEGLVGSGAKTRTLCGTPEYMAPEMLVNKCYGKEVDWWSFGVILFEMLTCLPPFFCENIQEMLNRIVNDPVTFPAHVSEHAKSLIEMLLEKDPNKRLSDPALIRRQPFFDGVDWTAVLEKRVSPPFVPQVSSKEDLRQISREFTDQDPTDIDPPPPAGGGSSSASGQTNAPLNKDLFAGFTYDPTASSSPSSMGDIPPPPGPPPPPSDLPPPLV